MIHASGINTIYTNVNIQPTQSILLEHTSCPHYVSPSIWRIIIKMLPSIY
ncbi:hypothetical protein A4157S3_270045 [Escherichia coli]|nr:hypothetical protein RCEC007_670044 [Escherichia coli]SOQ63930.1 hypothetical protein A4157S2_620019 [Escherichia coli]SOQ72438.1 hypothetical protein A4157S3_270045 [Escherichia coli]SOQ83447.1 hypothetical protein DSM301R_50019 [Escherichia coli]SOQ89507.1 hypothetical protein NC86S1_140045 [Escherichia coli]